MAADPSAALPSIEVEGLSAAYPGGARALRDVGFRIVGGRICGLVGPNGSGKSTLFKSIMGLLAPLAGRVRICGRDIAWARREGVVAYVPQLEEVDWTFPVSVRDVVTMGRQGRMGFLRIPSAIDRRIVEESLRRVGMEGFGERQIGELSGGQRKRVFLARALAQEASIILLDEPFTGVDRKTEEAIMLLLKGLRGEGRLLLVSTHDLAALPDLCDDVILLAHHLVAAGPVAETYTRENLARAFGAPPREIFGEAAAERTESRSAACLAGAASAA
ncbi:metal ABC transporter ATP-binding protein [Enterovirga sp.]|uniref:metal ABC transporter ATP-binding protein n=1 Tax=Enterovirga sp. TaxID=2026350 RepID=UPI002D1FA014|nr:metal ABC transporter ATP-binding protein [Enterovirga sp.]